MKLIKPLVSIIITSYNYEKFVKGAIESALNQSYKNIEIIVVDDGSTDNSPEIIKKYADRLVPVLKVNQGQSSAINAGFAKSGGEIICLLDSDDSFALNKIEKIVNIFNKFPEIGWCFHPLKCTDNNDRILDIYPPSPKYHSQVIDRRQEIVERAKTCSWDSPTSGLTFRRSLLEKILPLPMDVTQSPDTCLRIVALAVDKGFFLNEALSNMRLHGNNARFNARPIINFSQAIWLKRKLPTLQKMANKIFSLGLSTYCNSWSYNQDCNNIIKTYLSELSFSEYGEIILRTSYYFLRNLSARSH